MILLAIDCAANLCAACVYDAAAGRELGRAVRDLGKGHAEHLMDVLAEALQRSGKAYADLGRITVAVGPGSFTGVRVGVSTARGLALALSIPAVGVTTLEAIAAEASAGAALADVNVLAAIDAGRDGIYVGVYDPFGAVRYPPAIMTLEAAAALASRDRLLLAGSAAARIAALMPGDQGDAAAGGATADILTYARLGAARAPDGGKPRPLYLRAPDAKPQLGFTLQRRP